MSEEVAEDECMEGRSEEEEKGTGHVHIYIKGLRYRVIISTGAFEGLRHRFETTRYLRCPKGTR